MVLLYDSDVPYDTPDWTYDGAAIAGHIGYIRTLLLEDLKLIETLQVTDDTPRAVGVENDTPRSVGVENDSPRAVGLADDTIRNVEV